MRPFELRLSLAFAVIAPLPAFAQVPVAPVELPKVIFCTGPCFAVDDRGVRTPVNKGAVLREGQRLETGPGGYAQVKMGPAAELALSERGQVRFDQKSVGGRDLVTLDQGRIRMIGGEALGKATNRLLELRTSDGTFRLKGADVEVRKLTGTGLSPTLMKVNTGDANLGNISIPKDAVQGITGGKILTDQTFSAGDVRNPVVSKTTTVAPLPPVALPTDTRATTTLAGPTLTVAPTLAIMPITTTTAPTITTVKSTDLYVAPLTTTYTTSPTLFTSTSNLALTTDTKTASTTTTTTTTTTISPLLVNRTTSTSTLLRCATC